MIDDGDRDVNTLTINVLTCEQKTKLTINMVSLIENIRDWLIDHQIPLVNGQLITYRFKAGTALLLEISIQSENHIIVDQDTEIKISEHDDMIIFEGETSVKMNLNLLDLGIGGLDREFDEMFRRAFSSRSLKPETVRKLGISHIRGILLHGLDVVKH